MRKGRWSFDDEHIGWMDDGASVLNREGRIFSRKEDGSGRSVREWHVFAAGVCDGLNAIREASPGVSPSQRPA